MSDKPEMQRNDSTSSSAISSVPLSRTTSNTTTTTTATTPESASRRDSSTGAVRPSISSTSNVANDPALSALDTAQVSSKLSTIASAAAPFIVPGSDEGHPIEPLLRVFDPTKDAGLSIEQLLARPKLPRAPSERLAMDREKARAAALVSGAVVGAAVATVKELSPEEQELETRLEEQAERKKKEKEMHLQNIVKMADELNAALEKRKGQ